MRKLTVLGIAALFLQAGADAQDGAVKLRVKVALVAKDLSQKPVPHLGLQVTDAVVVGSLMTAKTNLDGIAEIDLKPGKYHLVSPDGVEFDGHRYSWDIELSVAGREQTVELSNDNANVKEIAVVPVRKVDELTTLFERLQNSVVTVWSEIGSGTGFIVDKDGLILTNQHVVGPSDLIAVQFDDERKIAAKLLAFDAQRDVAVLWANLSAFPSAVTAPIAQPEGGHDTVVVGERVFTIGSPLGRKKILTSGIASKIEEKAIISDVNINHGNSGGPLFNSIGQVIGITTFLIPGGNGPGISGIVRIEQSLPLLQQAKKKMRDSSAPDARLLPVEPKGSYPLDSLKESIQSEKFDHKAYVLGTGGYDVFMLTPVAKYRVLEAGNLAAAKEKAKRNRKSDAAMQNTFAPLQDLREWEEYVGEYKPVLQIRADPQLRETFMSAFGRGLAAANGGYGGPAHLKYKTDFYRMKLFCGTKEVEPIQPGKAASVVNVHNAFVNVTDATYVGIYTYPADAITPSCGKVSLELYSEKEPDKPTRKDLDARTVEHIASDFAPYLAMQEKDASKKSSAQK